MSEPGSHAFTYPDASLPPSLARHARATSHHPVRPPSRFKLLYLTKLTVMRVMGLAYLAADYLKVW